MTKKVLEDYRSAPIDEKLRATLALLEKVTLRPNEVTADDARAVLASSASRQAVIEALYVMFLFNTMDRVADALGWQVPSPEFFRRVASIMLKRGYA